MADYVDRLVAEIGSPPDVARAEALVARLPISIRIEGPTRQLGFASRARRADAASSRARRRLAQPHHGRRPSHQLRPRHLAVAARAAWHRLDHAGAAAGADRAAPMPTCAGCCGRSTTSAPAPSASAPASSTQPIPLRRRDELGDLARRINTMAHDIQAMLDAKRALLLALSHELRSPLTRARLNAELLPRHARERERTRRLAARPRRDARPDQRPARKRAPRQSARGAAARAGRSGGDWCATWSAEHPRARAWRSTSRIELPEQSLDRTRMRVAGAQPARQRAAPRRAMRRQAAAHHAAPATGSGVELEVRDFGPGVDAEQLERTDRALLSNRQRAPAGDRRGRARHVPVPAGGRGAWRQPDGAQCAARACQ